MSSSASRVWTISGSWVSRAAAMCDAEALPLPAAVRVVVIIIEAALADPDHLGMRAPSRPGSRSRRPGWMSASCGWMPTDAMTSLSRSAVAITASHSEARVEMLSIVDDAGGAGAGEHARLVLDQALVVEVAMAIDEHGAPVAAAAARVIPRHRADKWAPVFRYDDAQQRPRNCAISRAACSAGAIHRSCGRAAADALGFEMMRA